MANALYLPYKNQILGSGSLALADWDTNTMKSDLVDSADYTVNLTTHDAHDDVTSGGIVATATLASVVISAGGVDCADITFTSVTGDQSELLVFWKDTGTPSTSELCLYFDTFSSGMPVTPNGGNIVVVVNASGLFTF